MPAQMRPIRPLWHFRGYSAVLLLVMAVFSATPEAQGAWIPLGNSSGPDANGYVQITPELQNQVGAVWLDTPIDLSANFDMSFLVNLGDRDGNGADGLALVFQNDPRGPAAIGDNAAGGEWVGMHSIYPALAIEIDTWQNGSRGDPACDHVGINEFFDASSLPDHSGAGPVCATSSSANVEDGLDHLIRLVWDSAGPLLTVYFDGQEVLTYNREISAMFGGTSTAWFGVVASTGGSFNNQSFKAILPTSEIEVTKTVDAASVDPGDMVTYTVTMRNNSLATVFVNEIQDQLPAGFGYVPASSAGLTSSDPTAAGQVLTWTGNWLVDPGGSTTLVFQARSTSTPGVYFNDVTVRGSNFADLATGNTAQVIVGSDLSTSTMSVIDLNGGDVEPNDSLQYTVTLIETAGRDATGVSLADDLPPDVANLNLYLPLPVGSVDNSTVDQVNITNLTVPANGSLIVVFDVVVLNGTADGTTINNAAAIINPSGTGATLNATSLVVTNPSVQASGAKPLYLYDTQELSRRIIPGTQNELVLNTGQNATWTLAPSTYLPLTIDGSAGTIPVTLWIRGGNRRSVALTLSSSAGVIGTLGPLNLNSNKYGTAPLTFEIPVLNPSALVDVSSVILNVDNVSTGRNRRIQVQPLLNGIRSRVDLESLTVIQVESVRFFDAPYPGGSAVTSTVGGGTVYVRAVVSDPFGSFDISSAALTMTTPSGVSVVSNAAMNEVAADPNGPLKTYELAYPNPPSIWPATVENGNWTARVTAEEGTENLVRHTGLGIIQILGPPDIVLVKSVQAHEDPINGMANPFSLPGASMTYTVTVSNHGGSGITSDSVILTDAIPANTAYSVGDLGLPSGPVAFFDNPLPSGLTFNPASDVAFSMDSGISYNLTVADLIADANGCDPRITNVRINPKGIFNGASGSNVPGFTLQFRVKVK